MILSVTALSASAQNDKAVLALEQGKPVERELAGGQSHSYAIALSANQFLQVTVDQHGVDVMIEAYQPDDNALFMVDDGEIGKTETLFLVAKDAGDYRLKLRPFNESAAAGRYTLKIEELRPATERDKLRFTAQQTFKEGERLRVQDTVVSLNQSLKKYEEALPLFRALGDRAQETSVLHKMGRVYNDLGEMQKALDAFSQAVSVARSGGDRTLEPYALNRLGEIYKRLGEKEKALSYYNEALLLERAQGYTRAEAITLNNIANIYRDSGENRQALDYLQQSLKIMRGLGDRNEEATALNNLGSTYHELGEPQKALEYYNQALAIERALHDLRSEAKALDNIGRVYYSLHDPKALDYHKQALPLRRAVGDRVGEAATLYGIATIESDRGNLNEALKQIKTALDIIESLRSKINSQQLRTSYFASVQKYYELYIALLMRLHKKFPSEGHSGAALQINERARARSLLETLAEANADIRQGVDPQLLARERSLQKQLNAKAQEQMELLNSAHTSEQADAIAREIEALTAQFQQVEAEIRQTSPRYAALTQPHPLSLKEIQSQVLDSETLLLEYSLGEEQSYLWAVTPDSITSYELPKRAEIEQVARQVYSLLTDAERWTTGAQRGLGITGKQASSPPSPEAAQRLSQMLLAPVNAQLGKKRLLIVGDGALQFIPFSALPAPASNEGGDAARYQPLVMEHEIIALPSASTLAVLRRETQGRTAAQKMIAVIADPVFERDDQRIKSKAAQGAGGTLQMTGVNPQRGLGLELTKSAAESGLARAELTIPRLPGTRREAEQILSLVPPESRQQAFDFDANRQSATSAELSQYRYVHFATHGFLNSQHPELSGLILTMFDEQGQPQDGFLRAHEIFNLKLPAELVVLSACHTGLGKEIKGEGLVGMTRGFMYAGAPRIVVSLWSVSDAATAELMTRFYRGMLVDKLRPVKALQAAQLSMLKETKFSAPFFWAAFTLQGEWR